MTDTPTEHRYRRFWTAFLQSAAGRRVPLPPSARPVSYLYARGDHPAVRFGYGLRAHAAYLDLELDTGAYAPTKALYDLLLVHQAAIAVAAPTLRLDWQRGEAQRRSKITVPVETQGIADAEPTWPATQEQLLSAMTTFVRAIGP